MLGGAGHGKARLAWRGEDLFDGDSMNTLLIQEIGLAVQSVLLLLQSGLLLYLIARLCRLADTLMATINRLPPPPADA